VQVLLGVQNEREWQQLCSGVLGQTALAKDPRFCRPDLRVANRAVLDDIISAYTTTVSREVLLRTLYEAGVACAAVNSVKDLTEHPQLSTVQYHTSTGHLATVPAPPVTLSTNGHQPPAMPDVPTIGQHSAAIRAEFGSIKT
jgi:crotonobetainyl-CoA:carnitine CoA-transferase CaiB-like acyl-CoA transferase